MAKIKDLFQKIEDKELASIISEYLIKHIGDDNYKWLRAYSYYFGDDRYYLATKGPKNFLINYHNGTFKYLDGSVIAPAEKSPGNELFWIIVSFPGELSDYDSHSECKKGFWNGEQAVYEQYIPEQKLIVARVCTAKTVDEYYKSWSCMTGWKKLHTYDIPNIMKNIPADETIIVTETNPCEFAAIICDANNNQTSFYIEGESLYEAYYNYMVEKGYFKNINKKNKEYVKLT